MFQEMLEGLRERVTEILSRVEIQVEPTADQLKPAGPLQSRPLTPEQKETRRKRIDEIGQQRAMPRVNPKDRDSKNPASWGKVARNELCPCGSGKKYKHCHGVVGSQPTTGNV